MEGALKSVVEVFDLSKEGTIKVRSAGCLMKSVEDRGSKRLTVQMLERAGAGSSKSVTTKNHIALNLMNERSIEVKCGNCKKIMDGTAAAMT